MVWEISDSPPAPVLPDAIAQTVKVMAERGGLEAEAIAATLNLDVDKVKATLAPPPALTPAPPLWPL